MKKHLILLLGCLPFFMGFSDKMPENTPPSPHLVLENLVIEKEFGQFTVFQVKIKNKELKRTVSLQNVNVQVILDVFDTNDPSLVYHPRAVFCGQVRSMNHQIPDVPEFLAPGQSVLLRAIINCRETLPRRGVDNHKCYQLEASPAILSSKMDFDYITATTCSGSTNPFYPH